MSEDEHVDEIGDEVEVAEETDDGRERPSGDGVVESPGQEAAFETLLEFLKESRGFDFTGY